MTGSVQGHAALPASLGADDGAAATGDDAALVRAAQEGSADAV